LLLFCAPVFGELTAFAWSNPTSSHVLLVPLVTVALISQERERIFLSTRRDWPIGLTVILIGLVTLILGRRSTGILGPADALSLAVTGIVISAIGGFLLTFGVVASRAALFPLLFLGFAIPMPPVIVTTLTDLLKRGSTETVAGLFALTGTPFHRDGFVFSLPHFVIEVADECSGIRSSIALVLTSLLAGQTFLRSSWSKSLLLLAVLPISVLKNGIRIVALTLLAMHVDPGFLVGQLHHEGGVFFFLLALGMLAPFLPILRKLESLWGRRSQAT